MIRDFERQLSFSTVKEDKKIVIRERIEVIRRNQDLDNEGRAKGLADLAIRVFGRGRTHDIFKEDHCEIPRLITQYGCEVGAEKLKTMVAEEIDALPIDATEKGNATRRLNRATTYSFEYPTQVKTIVEVAVDYLGEIPAHDLLEDYSPCTEQQPAATETPPEENTGS